MKENCLFCEICKGTIPANVVLENERFLAFHDINPVAPVHVLVIPKQHVSNIAHITEANAAYVEGLLSFIKEVAKELQINADGYRVVLNTGAKAGQTVFHLHAHIMGGKELGWPNID